MVSSYLDASCSIRYLNCFIEYRRLDYCLLSERLLPNFCDCLIRNKVFGSDHCPIALLLQI